MKKRSAQTVFFFITSLLIVGLCITISFMVLGSSLAVLLTGVASASPTARATPRPPKISELPPLPTVTDTPIPVPTATFTPNATPTPVPTDTPTSLPSPTPLPTETPLPTATDTPLPPPPSTATPLPTDTPLPPPPAYDFIIKESDQFSTNHFNFDVYVAVVDSNNSPLRDYRVIGTHSSGLQLESAASAGDWTQNSGANHYKGGNIKYEAFNSPQGIWTLQLVDAGGTPVAPPVEYSFDPSSPTWYFLYFERQ